MLYLLVAVLTAFGAFARRFMGGLGGDNPRFLRVASVAFPTMLAAGVALWSVLGPFWTVGLSFIILLGTASIAGLGDGDATDLGEWHGREPDAGSWDFLAGVSDNTKSFVDRYRRDFLALMISGVAQTAVAGVAVVLSGFVLPGVLLGLSGILKAPAYGLGYLLPSGLRDLHHGRELGEVFWGGSLGLSAGLVIVSIRS